MPDPREPRVTRPGGLDPPEETTARNEPSPELLASLSDDGDRVTVRRRIVLGPDGIPQVIDDEETEETTRRHAITPARDE